jgi:SAM-dependent methyltransferase
MRLDELQRHWDELGRQDPLWAIATHGQKDGGRWEVEEFFATGREQVAKALAHVASLGFPLPRRRALDFGCGVGRLTQALAEHFDEVYGVDIAPSMIERAREHNRHGDRCKYLLNPRRDLRAFADGVFDFVYTSLVLQHMEPCYAKAYLKEFLRTLAPGGLIVYQLPSERIAPGLGRRAKDLVRSLVPRPVLYGYHALRGTFRRPSMEMYGIPRRRVERFLKAQGARLVDVVATDAAPGWHSFRYCVTKP